MVYIANVNSFKYPKFRDTKIILVSNKPNIKGTK